MKMPTTHGLYSLVISAFQCTALCLNANTVRISENNRLLKKSILFLSNTQQHLWSSKTTACKSQQQETQTASLKLCSSSLVFLPVAQNTNTPIKSGRVHGAPKSISVSLCSAVPDKPSTTNVTRTDSGTRVCFPPEVEARVDGKAEGWGLVTG